MTERTIALQRRARPASVWLLTAGAFFAFFIFGYVDNLKGPVLPVLLDDLSFSYTSGGTLLLGSYFGFLVATLATGILADQVGNKVILLAAGLLLTAGLALFSVGATFWWLLGGMTLAGLGLGAIEVGGNALIVEVHDTRRGRFLNLLGVFHGIGSFCAPLMAAQLLINDFSWRQVYQVTLVLTVSLALFFALVRYPPRVRGSETRVDFGALRAVGFTRPMLLYYLLITTYVAAELGVASWLVVFLQQEKGMSLARSSLYLSLFFVFLMLGRLLGSFVVDRIGYLRIMLLAMLGGIGSLAAGIFGPPGLAVLIPFTGFFFSIVFPTATAEVSGQHSQNQGAILGLLFAFGGLGGALGPWVMGITIDAAGIAAGFTLPIIYCCIALGALLALLRLQRRATPVSQ